MNEKSNIPVFGYGVVKLQPQSKIEHMMPPEAMSYANVPVQCIPVLEGQQKVEQRNQHAYCYSQNQAVNSEATKHRYFDEQKELLKQFGVKKPKENVSTDTMFKNLLDKNQSSMFKSSQGRQLHSSGSSHISYGYRNPNEYAHIPNQQFPNDSNASPYLPHSNPYNPVHSEGVNALNTPHGTAEATSHGFHSLKSKIPLKLPIWLSDESKIPEVYKKATNLVQSEHDLVDRNRAYLLLMQTQVPPQILAVLWEQVNRGQEGQLRVHEFQALLALVACIQAGNPLARADDLIALNDPVYPLIDHPALANLHTHDIQGNTLGSQEAQLPNIAPPESNEDDFGDFLSAKAPPPESESDIFMSNSFSTEDSKTAQNSIPNSALHNISHAPKNLPIVGMSPLHSKADQPEGEDDFDEFQVAMPISANLIDKFPKMIDKQSHVEDSKSHVKDTVPSLLDEAIPCSTNVSDKYAAFRDAENEPNDDEFGDFCSSRSSVPVASTTYIGAFSTDGSLESFPSDPSFSCTFPGSTSGKITSEILPTDTNSCASATIPIICKASGDVSKATNLVESIVSSFSDSANDMVENPFKNKTMNNDPDDDFGDFVGSSGSNLDKQSTHVGGSEMSSVNAFWQPEISSETQSISSLELPEFDTTIRLTSETSGTSYMDDFLSLSLSEADPPKLNEAELKISSGFSQEHNKYNVIREQEGFSSIGHQISQWSKCLYGCLKLLTEARDIFKGIEDESFIKQLMATSQMNDYINNLTEVWEVSRRIECSNREKVSDLSVRNLCEQIDELWKIVLKFSDSQYLNHKEDSVITKSHCSICLDSTNVHLVYGGHSYHPTCANLWLNAVDLTLPSYIHIE